MKTSLPSSSRFPRYRTAALLAASLLTIHSASAVDWIGADGLGGDGIWNAANFGGSTPTLSTDVVFQTTGTLTNTTATVAISGTASVRGLSVYNNKTVTINMASTSLLRFNDRVLNVGGTAAQNIPSTSSLTIAGPETGRATINATRFYIEGNTTNVGTVHRNTLKITGNIDVNLGSSFSAAGSQSSIEILNGATVTTNPGAVPNNNSTSSTGAFYSRGGMDNGIYRNNITIKNASVYSGNIFAYGLLQLGQGGVLGISSLVTSGTPRIMVTTGASDTTAGRFEAEGSGLAANFETRVDKGGTFAVGLSDPRTMIRAEAASFTLNSRIDFAAGTFLELGIFGNGVDEYDKITIGATGSIHNYNSTMTTIGTGATLVLKIHDLDFTPVYGQSYSFFDIDPTNTTAFEGAFNLSQIDTTLWDLSNFNSAGGWQMTAIPEPGTVSLMVMSGLALAAGAFRRYRKKSHAA